MPKETLKVKGKQRTIDDTDDGLVYKLTLTSKEGKKGEPTYQKWKLIIEEGTPHIYDTYEPEELLRVNVDAAHRKLDEFQEDPETEAEG